MTDPRATAGLDPRDEVPVLSFANLLLRHRRVILAMGVIGSAVGLASGLLSTRKYVSYATFIPQGSEQATSGLALAASQFGIRVPSSGGTWGPPVYVQLLRSRAILEPVLFDTVTVAEENNRRVAVIDLLGVGPMPAAQRLERGVARLSAWITPSEVKALNAVRVSVATKWPSVSLAVANSLIRHVNRFNLETRKSSASAERQFADQQVNARAKLLTEAESNLLADMQGNRIAQSPEQQLRRSRLEREVAMQQQLYNALLQNREEARLREVRDTPVITMLEDPRQPASGEARRSVQKGILGGIAGVTIGALVTLLMHWLRDARNAGSPDAQEFYRLVGDMLPRRRRQGTA